MARVGLGTGILWEVRPRGLLEAVRVLALARAQNVSHIYRVHGQNLPTKVALVFREKSYTFGELDAQISRVARGLDRRGLGRDQSLVVLSRNRPELILASSGGARLGARVVTASFRSTAREIRYLLENAHAGAVVFEADLADAVAEALGAGSSREALRIPKERLFVVGGTATDATPFDALLDEPASFALEEEVTEDAALVMYTSGTTGKPKGAVRKFRRGDLLSWVDFIGATPLRSDDVHLAVCPLYHATGMAFLGMSHLLGARCVLADEFSPEGFLDAVEAHHVTTTAVVPTMLHRIMALDPSRIARAPRTLRAMFVGGAPLPGPLGTAVMNAFGDVLFNFYGSTETGIVTLATPRDLREAPTTIGHALPNVTIRLLDESGAEVPPRSVGELYVAAGTLVEGYYEDDAATRASKRDEFFSVGDLAYEDDEGRLFLVGRKRDMIISGGVNVYPAEVEGVLEQHSGVSEVAVVGEPDDELGERVVAFVVPKPGVSLEQAELVTYCRSQLAGPKRPKIYHFVAALPKNATGKVLKRELRDQARGAAPPAC